MRRTKKRTKMRKMTRKRRKRISSDSVSVFFFLDLTNEKAKIHLSTQTNGS